MKSFDFRKASPRALREAVNFEMYVILYGHQENLAEGLLLTSGVVEPSFSPPRGRTGLATGRCHSRKRRKRSGSDGNLCTSARKSSLFEL